MTRAVLESRALIAHVAMQQIVEELVSSSTMPVEERVEWHISRGKLRAAASQNDHGAAAEAVRLFERAVELSNTEAPAEASAAALAEYRKHAQLCLELCAHVERTRELQQRAVAEGVGVDWLGPAMYGGSQPNDASGARPRSSAQFLFEYRDLAMGSLIRVGGSQDSLVAACNRATRHPDDPTAAADVEYSAQKCAMLGRQFVVLEGVTATRPTRFAPESLVSHMFFRGLVLSPFATGLPMRGIRSARSANGLRSHTRQRPGRSLDTVRTCHRSRSKSRDTLITGGITDGRGRRASSPWESESRAQRPSCQPATGLTPRLLTGTPNY